MNPLKKYLYTSARSTLSMRGIAVAPVLTPIQSVSGSAMQSKEVTLNPTPILPPIIKDGERLTSVIDKYGC